MISIYQKAILVNKKCIYGAPSRIEITHIFNDKILLLYNPYQLIPQGLIRQEIPVLSDENLAQVNRNVLMIDFSGNILWRIKSDTPHYNPWTVIGTDVSRADSWIASTQDGYQYDIDIQNGKLSNGLLMK